MEAGAGGGAARQPFGGHEAVHPLVVPSAGRGAGPDLRPQLLGDLLQGVDHRAQPALVGVLQHPAPEGREAGAEHRGEVVLLTFWGSRCGQCGAQLAALSRLVDTYRSAGLAALAVGVDDDPLAAARFAVAHPVSFPVLLDPDKGVARAYRVDNLPMLMLIDRSGTVRHVHRDYRSGDGEKFLQRIRPLLDE